MVVQMSSSKENELAKQMSKKLQSEIEKCQTVSDFVNLVFSFKHDSYTIMPIQIKSEIEKLISVLNNQKPKAVMEIGTANGGTLFLLCQAAATSDAKIISLDLLGGEFGGELFPSWKEPFYQNFSKKNQQLSLIRADSHDSKTFKKVKQILGTKKLDFLLIDGDHEYEGVKKDFLMYGKLVSPSGIIAFHDINPGPKEEVGGVPTFWKEIAGKYPSFEIIDDGRSGSYGIGFLIFESLDKPLMRYTKIAKNLFEIQEFRLNNLQRELHKVNLVVQEKDKKLHDHDQMIIEKDKHLQQFKDELHKVNLAVQEKDKELESLDEIPNLQKTIQNKNQILEKKQEYLENKENEIEQKIQSIKQMKVIISELERIKNENQVQLKQYKAEIEAILNSKTWKTLQKYVKVKKFFTGKN